MKKKLNNCQKRKIREYKNSRKYLSLTDIRNYNKCKLRKRFIKKRRK